MKDDDKMLKTIMKIIIKKEIK